MKARNLLPMNLQFFADDDDKGNGADNPDLTGEGTKGAGTTGEGKNDDDKGDGAGEESKEKTFTQKQVSAMMSKEKKQGKNAAYAELGIDPNNAQQVAMVKALIDSQKTDEQRQQELDAQNAAKIAEAEHRAMVAEAKAEAMKIGAKSEFVDDVIALAMTKVDDKTDVVSVIGDLKTKYPMWFGEESEDDKKSTGQKGTGSSVGNGGTGSNSKGGNEPSFGARLAANRNQVRAGGKERKSFWD